MSPGQTLRAFVTARLAAAAEDIFELFERTILEYEEELCRCKKKRRQEEAQDEERRQEEAHDVQTASQTFGPDFTHETAETPQVKEEPEEERLKEEEEEQQDNDPEYSVAHVKTETRISSETTRQTEAFTHTDDEEDWREMDTEADVDHYNQAQRATSSGLCPKYKSAVEIGGDVGSSSDTDDDDDDNDSEMTYPEMTENPEDLTGTAQGDDVRQFQSRFLAKEKAHHCPSCDKTFVYIAALIKHMKTHKNGDEDAGKKHRCDMCDKRFSRRQQLQRHSRTHTGEKPYECPVCLKRVCTSQSLVIHMRTHTGEKPFSCLVCGKRFIDNSTLLTHTTIHTGERPYSCQLCQKGFVKPSRLEAHMRKNH
ncbi:unnamed protein product [Knipowitschia caucasica]